MHWIVPSERDHTNGALEKRLWGSADQFRANSGLKAQEYSGPIPGIIFLRFAEVRFAAQRAKLEKSSSSSRRASPLDEPAAYHAESILYLAPDARFDVLLNPSEQSKHSAPPGIPEDYGCLAGMRNKMSDAHASSYRASKHHAKLAVNSAKTFADFVFDS